MLLFWRIRYLDTHDREFKDRDLWLETDDLDAATRVTVELCHELGGPWGSRDMLRHRHLFQEREYSGEELNDLVARSGGMSSVAIPDYFEDENGEELTRQQLGQALTGDPDTVMLPAGMKQHDIDFMFAPKPAVDIRKIQVAKPDLDALTYFSRDFCELKVSNFLVEGPGTLSLAQGIESEVDTAVSDDEIRSFVTIFRRLYMAREPGNFAKAADVFSRVLLPHSVAKWVQGVVGEYEKALTSTPDLVPFAQTGGATFTRKRLIDAFIYTQYAHQGDERRERHYAECLAQVKGKRGVLFWLFLKCIWECARHIHNAGLQIASFTEQYCRRHGITPSAVGPAAEYVGMGQLEKQGDREARIFAEKVDELAAALWEEAGQPVGGPIQFVDEARRLLSEAVGG